MKYGWSNEPEPTWTPPETVPVKPGEWDGNGPVPEAWKNLWTVVSPGVYVSPVTKQARVEDCMQIVRFGNRWHKPGELTRVHPNWGSERKYKTCPMLLRSKKDAEAVVRALVGWMAWAGWMNCDFRRYDPRKPLAAEQRDRKTGIWVPMAKVIPMSEYRVFMTGEERIRELSIAPVVPKQAKPPKQAKQAPSPTLSPSPSSAPSAQPARFGANPGGFRSSRIMGKFDPDCLEKAANAGWHGLRDAATGKWLRAAEGSLIDFSLVDSEMRATAFPDRISAANAMCSMEQRTWIGDVAVLRLRVEKLSDEAQKAFSERKASSPRRTIAA